MKRVAGWLRNPWSRPRFLPAFTAMYLVWSRAPGARAGRWSVNTGVL
jgi:hypothetical protein